MPLQGFSRWTLAWFASALGFLVLALAGLAAGFAGPGDWARGTALAVVHLFVLGWLGQMMAGSLIQFTPVLAARPAALGGLAPWALGLFGAGTAALAMGFLALEGWEPGRWLLAGAPVLLGGAIAALAAAVGATLAQGGAWRGAAGRPIVAALAALGLTWASGGAMALAYGGFGGALIGEGRAFHALLGIGGWMSLGAFGVSYRLFSMFLVAPETGGRLRDATLALGVAAVLMAATGLGLLLAGRETGVALVLALALSGLCAGLYLADVRRIWRARRRPTVEANMRMTRPALAALAATVALAGPGWLWGGAWAEAAVFCALAGWLSTLTLAQMVKITSFLTWMQVFGPQIGRARVPMVSELTNDRRAARWLGLWALGAALGALALLLRSDPGLRVAALMLLAAVLGLVVELVAIRRLDHLPQDRRPHRPPLFLPPPAAEPAP